MNYNDLFKPLQKGKGYGNGLINVSTQRDILIAILGWATIEGLNENSDRTTFSRWFNKGLPENDSERIKNEISIDGFTASFAKALNRAELPRLCREYGIQAEEGHEDCYALANAFARQLLDLAERNGEAGPMMPAYYREYTESRHHPVYVREATKKFSWKKTLLYSEGQPFYDFYVCNYLGLGHSGYSDDVKNIIDSQEEIEDDDQYISRYSPCIENVTPEKLRIFSRYAILTGMGGMGKSMMMTHLYLSALQHFSTNDVLPIFVTLRDYDFIETDLMTTVCNEVSRYEPQFSQADITCYLTEGKTCILLDGLDEIKEEAINLFLRKLDRFIDTYPNNQYILSSRSYSSFVELPRFLVFKILPLSCHQAVTLIENLVYLPEEPKFKESFLYKLRTEYYQTHQSFVSNPLLLTLMFMSYRRFQDVPQKKYLFYKQAYETLLYIHDANKLSGKREFRSVEDPSEFTKIFSEFCAKTYLKKSFDFTADQIRYYFERLKAKDLILSKKLTADNFIYDACNSACVMFEEGGKYSFLHRAFQEYFFADFYSKTDDTTYDKLFHFLNGTCANPNYDVLDAVTMLVELHQEKFEKLAFLPLFEPVFSASDDEESYWRFLQVTYGKWNYYSLNERFCEHYLGCKKQCFFEINNASPFSNTNVIVSQILSKYDLSDLETLLQSNLEVYKDLSVPEGSGNNMEIFGYFMHGKRFGQTLVLTPTIRPQMLEEDYNTKRHYEIESTVIKNEEGTAAVLGVFCSIAFEEIYKDKERHKDLFEFWNWEEVRRLSRYDDIKHRYYDIKRKYRTNVEDDDPFSW